MGEARRGAAGLGSSCKALDAEVRLRDCPPALALARGEESSGRYTLYLPLPRLHQRLSYRLRRSHPAARQPRSQERSKGRRASERARERAEQSESETARQGKASEGREGKVKGRGERESEQASERKPDSPTRVVARSSTGVNRLARWTRLGEESRVRQATRICVWCSARAACLLSVESYSWNIAHESEASSRICGLVQPYLEAVVDPLCPVIALASVWPASGGCEVASEGRGTGERASWIIPWLEFNFSFGEQLHGGVFKLRGRCAENIQRFAAFERGFVSGHDSCVEILPVLLCVS